MCLMIWSKDSAVQIGLFSALFRAQKSATSQTLPGTFFGTTNDFEAHRVSLVDGDNIPPYNSSLNSATVVSGNPDLSDHLLKISP